MRYPKAVEQTAGTVTGENGRTDAEVIVFVGADRDGTPRLKIETEADDRSEAIEANPTTEQVAEMRDALEELHE